MELSAVFYAVDDRGVNHHSQKDVGYSYASVRDQIVHLISVDDTWFSALRGVEIPEPLNPANFDDRKIIRAHWDNVEQNMRDYLTELRDEMLFEKPFADGEDQDLVLWQVLLHVGILTTGIKEHFH